ncbi:MAG: hypothetical protein U5Q03_18050 [Bacteroidota bacterium]|nr:hypothetical protein [Bacteroidota bacterium]
MISQILPNARPDDFIINSNIIDEENALIRLARKDLVKEVIELFHTDHSFILDVMIGPLQIEQILPLVGYEEQKLFVGEYKFLLQEGTIIDCALAGIVKVNLHRTLGGRK